MKNNNEEYARLEMHKAAWLSALDCSEENFKKKKKAFPSRKPCSPFSKEECEEAFLLAFQIAKSTNKYIRSNVGGNQPEVVRWYEHLYLLAKTLREEFPEASGCMIACACTSLESRWYR